jgi:hypothetical protein
METNKSSIFSIMAEMQGLGLVRCSTDFSIDWLGREGSYVRCLRTKKRRPSAQVLATCAVRLLKLADITGTAKTDGFAVDGEVLRALASRCLDALLETGLHPVSQRQPRPQTRCRCGREVAHDHQHH